MGWVALGEEGGVFVVEVEELLGGVPAFDFVGLEDGAIAEAGFDEMQFPGKVDGVVESGVHSLTRFGGVGVTNVASHEDSVVERIFVC